MDSEDQKKTAIVLPHGQFEFIRLPFGLKGAPATSVRVMNEILAGLNFVDCFVYFDDIIIFGKDIQEHNERLERVLSRLQEANVKLCRHKCVFGTTRINYLGYDIGADGVKLSKDNVKKLLEMPEPKNVTEVRRLLGLGSRYRKFVQGFTSIVRPLQSLLKKDTMFIWDERHQGAFEQLKKCLCTRPILALFRDELELRTNASDNGL